MVRVKWPMQILVMLAAAREKLHLYKGKDVMKRNVNSETAVDELIMLLKEHNEWVEPEASVKV